MQRKTYEKTNEKTYELVMQVLRGNSYAVEGFYNMLLPFIKSVIRRQSFYLKGITIEELSHDLVVKTYFKLDKFDKERPLLPWVAMIVKNHLIDLYRMQQSEQLHSIDELFENNSWKIKLMQHHTEYEQDFQAELTSKISSLLDKLNDNERALITGVYLEEKPLKIIAKEQGYSSVNALSIRLYRIRQKLKKHHLILSKKVDNP